MNARCLAGVLLCAMAGAALRADEAAPQPSAAVEAAAAEPGATAAATPAVDATLSGPLSLSLGAAAMLDLPAGWRWVGPSALKAYLAPSGRSVGAWDLGVALGPGGSDLELRLQLEPMGAVAPGDPAGLDPDALLQRLQAKLQKVNEHRRLTGQPELSVSGWAQSPAMDADGQRLSWAEQRLSNGEERVAWHGRLLLRQGVIKMDVNLPREAWEAAAPLANALFDAVTVQAEQAWAGRQDGDRPAPLDRAGLVEDAVLGRGGLAQGPSPDELSRALAWQLAGWAALALALTGGALAAWRWFKGLRIRRMKERLDEARLAQLEKDLGGNAEDVEEIADDEDETPA